MLGRIKSWFYSLFFSAIAFHLGTPSERMKSGFNSLMVPVDLLQRFNFHHCFFGLWWLQSLLAARALRDGTERWQSIVYPGLLPMTSMSLRLAAVEYLRPLGRMFADRMERPFRGRCDSYISFMKQESSWGDELTCLPCSHLLRRPIHIVTDSVDNLPFVRSMTHQT